MLPRLVTLIICEKDMPQNLCNEEQKFAKVL